MFAPWENYDISTYWLTANCSASELPRIIAERRGLDPQGVTLTLFSKQVYTPV